MKRGKIKSNINPNGINLILKTNTRKINTHLVYPEKIWRLYDKKERLTKELTYLLTLPLPLIANLQEIKYNTQKPRFFHKFQKLMLKDLPSSTYEYKKQDAKQLKKIFLSTKFFFSNKKKDNKAEIIDQEQRDSRDSLLLLSFGKDSLLSLGILNEINMPPISLYINDTVSPTENQLKINTLNNLIKEKILTKAHVVTNSIEKLNDFDTWKREEMTYNYAHMITSFNFIALPLLNFYNSKYIITGNEQNMDFFLNKKSKKIYPVYDQSTEWTKEQDKMLKTFQKNISVFSIIKPITDIAVLKILHSRYPMIAKHQISCYGLDASNRKRWCHDCFACTGTSLFLSAFNINPKVVGLPKFFKKKHKKLYSLFNPEKMDVYDAICSREQELLAFLMATRNKQKGHIIDLFKKYYLKEALAREEELRKKYFKIYNSRIPKKIKPKVLSIYKEELKDLV